MLQPIRSGRRLAKVIPTPASDGEDDDEIEMRMVVNMMDRGHGD